MSSLCHQLTSTNGHLPPSNSDNTINLTMVLMAYTSTLNFGVVHALKHGCSH
ncbi:hypothetical protein BCR42DRAFT_428484 [Absidia repens]|uniref:Uncharacterized protein n=1 Tax=Absidia repens TaxID=90262 RepID=A0A1X2HYC3_9FUNG|nr:hypothetical protein BCR42DRAFT_428484 [Absidia repens]